MVQHQHQRRGIEPRVVDRQRLELAAPKVDVVESRAAASCAACSIAADASTATTRATNGASAALTWPVPQPRSPTVQSLLGERRQRGEMKPIAEQLVAHAIPLAGRRREELLRLGAPLGERRLQPALVLRRRRRRSDLLAHQQPEPPRGGVELVAASSCRGGSCLPRATAIQPASASALRCRLTVDCGSCMMLHSSDTVSSWRSSSSRMRLRVVSASEAR